MSMRPVRDLAPLLSLALFAPACLFGSGVAETEVRELGEFTAIHNSAALDVEVQYVTPGTPLEPAELTCDDNLLDDIDTEVAGGVLRIDSGRRELRTHTTCTLSLQASALSTLAISGPGSITAEGPFGIDRVDVDGPADLIVRGLVSRRIVVTADGPSHLALSGRVETAEIHVDGPADVEAAGLAAQSLVFDGSGPLSADLFASEHAEVVLDGPGDVRVHGDPVTRDVDVDGPGDVHFE
ncbi:MAG: DUF2807 domain-containing protein [Nannocystaceae bacterium]